MELLEEIGLTLLDAPSAATLNAARVLRIDKDYGSIENGKIADLLILNANPLENIQNTRKISAVFKSEIKVSGGRHTHLRLSNKNSNIFISLDF